MIRTSSELPGRTKRASVLPALVVVVGAFVVATVTGVNIMLELTRVASETERLSMVADQCATFLSFELSQPHKEEWSPAVVSILASELGKRNGVPFGLKTSMTIAGLRPHRKVTVVIESMQNDASVPADSTRLKVSRTVDVLEP